MFNVAILIKGGCCLSKRDCRAVRIPLNVVSNCSCCLDVYSFGIFCECISSYNALCVVFMFREIEPVEW